MPIATRSVSTPSIRSLLVLAAAALLLAAPLTGYGWGQREPVAETEEDTKMEIEVGQVREFTGRLRVIGNEPFAQLVLTLERVEGQRGEQSYAIMDEFHDELWERQQQTITLRAEVIALPTTGMPGAIEVREVLSD
ncbi:hypothetical protein [Spirochaeta africana]|uniref:Uncharacterized protein n=1 Tax=Spirochaeta africana (strain ATCC 700263 / DSM 8902 / Z-7692) TaxID=889378 RepID=H9UGS6_SPIAZ|nr:hypothetical protein [Spirochaeta africana]AFG36719.1 hypothetical protein Spiaf_0619 [Spirochaeta africana DSM 8902]